MFNNLSDIPKLPPIKNTIVEKPFTTISSICLENCIEDREDPFKSSAIMYGLFILFTLFKTLLLSFSFIKQISDSDGLWGIFSSSTSIISILAYLVILFLSHY